MRPSPGESAWAQKNNRSRARGSEISLPPRSRMRSCANSREATRLLNTSGDSRPAACASNIAAASFHSVAAWRLSVPAPRPAKIWLIRCAAPGVGVRMIDSIRPSMAERVSASGWQATARSSGGSGSHCQSWNHKSAGWMRSAPASSCTARYCGNIAKDDTDLPASKRAT